MTAAAHIITAVIGSGVLSLAWATSTMGWIAGPIVLLMFSAVTWYCSWLLADAYRHPMNTGRRTYTYPEAVDIILGEQTYTDHHCSNALSQSGLTSKCVHDPQQCLLGNESPMLFLCKLFVCAMQLIALKCISARSCCCYGRSSTLHMQGVGTVTSAALCSTSIWWGLELATLSQPALLWCKPLLHLGS